MSDQFNAYAQWLGLDDHLSAPDYYQLLGLVESEADDSAIAAAADRAMARVRGQRPGDHAAAWAKLLDELQSAKRCLTDADARAEYDRRRQEARQASSSASPAPVETNVNRSSPQQKVQNDNTEWRWPNAATDSRNQVDPNIAQSAPAELPQSTPTAVTPQQAPSATPQQAPTAATPQQAPSAATPQQAPTATPQQAPTAAPQQQIAQEGEQPTFEQLAAGYTPTEGEMSASSEPAPVNRPPITVGCCGRKFEADASLAGQRTTCPICGRVVLVPNPAAMDSDSRIDDFEDAAALAEIVSKSQTKRGPQTAAASRPAPAPQPAAASQPVRAANPAAAVFNAMPAEDAAPAAQPAPVAMAAPAASPTPVASPAPVAPAAPAPHAGALAKFETTGPANTPANADEDWDDSSQSSKGPDVAVWLIVALSAVVAFLLLAILAAVGARLYFG